MIWNTIQHDDRLLKMVYGHFGAIVVLPFAGYAALGLVMLLESRSEQPIELKVIGFEFKGASAPIVLWVLCFVPISICLRLMWQTQ